MNFQEMVSRTLKLGNTNLYNYIKIRTIIEKWHEAPAIHELWFSRSKDVGATEVSVLYN